MEITNKFGVRDELSSSFPTAGIVVVSIASFNVAVSVWVDVSTAGEDPVTVGTDVVTVDRVAVTAATGVAVAGSRVILAASVKTSCPKVTTINT